MLQSHCCWVIVTEYLAVTESTYLVLALGLQKILHMDWAVAIYIGFLICKQSMKVI